MTAPDGRIPRPRAWHDEPSRRPASGAPSRAWFSYNAAGDEITFSEALGVMLGRGTAPQGHGFSAPSGGPGAGSGTAPQGHGFSAPSGGPGAGISTAPDEAGRQLLTRYVHRDDRARALGAITRAWSAGETVDITVRLVRADGSWFDVDCELEPVAGPDDVVRGIRGTITDVTARERARREDRRLARREETVQISVAEPDPATGLLTRAGFADELDRTLRHGGAVLVIRVEPDRTLRDHIRPERNAELLHRAARVLEGVVATDDRLGRVGPNEIGVLMAGTTWAVARRQAELFVEALRAQTFVLPDAWSRARAWGGLVRFPPGTDASSHDLLIDAEQAWRKARHAGRILTQVPQPVPVRDRQGSYRDRVADALGTDRFTLYSQPILELQSNSVTRHELLLRVLDDTDGPQSPSQVLDTAERLDAVFDIDLWVVERALQLSAERTDLNLQINLSGRSVGDPRLTVEVERLLKQYQAAPEQLTFEITETALIGNLSEARRFADRVRELGCQLALDDFGSGYASFRYLRLFPIDLVKIDGEYVVDLVRNLQDQVLVRALVQVCQAYGIHTVAEFVQDEPTLRLLRELGVDYVQGFLIGRPAPFEKTGFGY
jgi:EAL domain-containing protein (putative c-di-GMP-specific phosphodiesterase class I)/GGDEF domain-containing protein